jgi:hypothetical protein
VLVRIGRRYVEASWSEGRQIDAAALSRWWMRPLLSGSKAFRLLVVEPQRRPVPPVSAVALYLAVDSYYKSEVAPMVAARAKLNDSWLLRSQSFI